MGLPCVSTTVVTGVAKAMSRVDITWRVRPNGDAK